MFQTDMTEQCVCSFYVLCYFPLEGTELKLEPFKKPTNCLSLFDHFVGLALKGLSSEIDQADFTDWMSFLLSNPTKEISPYAEALNADI